MVPLCERVMAVFAESLPQYRYEIVLIDNASTDGTRAKIEALCAAHTQVRAIFNARNFGQFRSPFYGICQTTGDCTIPLCADFQDPVELIPRLVAEWERGYRVVCAVKTASRENPVMRFCRTCYYRLLRRSSEVAFIEHFTGFGLYDRRFVEVMRSLDDPSPFLRGVVAELGFRMTTVPYTQAKRRAGRTHNSLLSLYDAAWQSFTAYTKTPIRAVSAVGWLLLSAAVLSAVLLTVRMGTASPAPLLWQLPLALFLSAVHLIALGAVGEYLLLLRDKVTQRPLVVEERRLNFDKTDDARDA